MWKSPAEELPDLERSIYVKYFNSVKIEQLWSESIPTWDNIEAWCYEEELFKLEEKKERKYMPSMSDLIDRLSIINLKEIFIKEYKKEYAKEIEDIMNDIDIIIKEENLVLNADTIRAISLVSQLNLHIWMNETRCRNGDKEGNDLYLTHSLNSLRQIIKNKIQELSNGRKDYKINTIKEAKDYIPSGYEKYIKE